jgi:hypothetical protein
MSKTNRSVGDISDIDFFNWLLNVQPYVFEETGKEIHKSGQETRSFHIANMKGVCARAYFSNFPTVLTHEHCSMPKLRWSAWVALGAHEFKLGA